MKRKKMSLRKGRTWKGSARYWRGRAMAYKHIALDMMNVVDRWHERLSLTEYYVAAMKKEHPATDRKIMMTHGL